MLHRIKTAEHPVLTTAVLELVAAHHFNPRRNIVVPNVSWGLGLRHEADLVVLRSSGWADEVELKISAADIKADTKKACSHTEGNRFRRLWFAVPEVLAQNPDIPAAAGIIAVTAYRGYYYAKAVRQPTLHKAARRFSAADREKLLRLAYLRIWSARQRLARLRCHTAKTTRGTNDSC